MAKQAKRRRVFVDSRVQGALLRRMAIYWIVFLGAFLLQFTFWSVCMDPLRPLSETIDDVGRRTLPAVLASAWLLPVVLYDLVKMSNRFVGPVVRLRTALGELAAGKETRDIEFRDNDHWREIAVGFNSLNARLKSAEQRLAALKASPSSQEDAAEQDADLVGAAGER
jgi:hypothetical protein